MPRAFLIKKKQNVKCCSSAEKPKKIWSYPWIETEAEDENGEKNGRQSPVEIAVTDAKGPYDLSMKPKSAEEPSISLTELSIRRSPSPTVPLVAPRPIKPTPKTTEEIAALKSSWQLYSQYLQYNYPSYGEYPSRPESYGSSYPPPSQQGLSPPALVPITSAVNNRDRYSPSQDRYSPYDVQYRERITPPMTQSPSPLQNLLYSGWMSDGQDSGLASSPSPSSEDGDAVQNAKQTSQTRYQCPDCNKNYSTYSGLSKHRLMHCSTQVKKSFSCKYCDKIYVSLGALKMHIRTHTLPCKCKLCGKAFSRPWLLQGHIRTHTGEKPFSCPHCSRAFADRSNLRAHLQTHSEIKKYRCKTCSKTFSRMSLLQKHEDGGCSGVPQQQ